MARALSDLYDADQDDVGHFLDKAFRAADRNRDRRINFSECAAHRPPPRGAYAPARARATSAARQPLSRPDLPTRAPPLLSSTAPPLFSSTAPPLLSSTARCAVSVSRCGRRFHTVASELSEAMKNGFVRSSGYRTKAVEAKIVQGHSWRRALGEVGFQDAETVSDVTSRRGGRLRLDANPLASTDVLVRFPKTCVTDENRGMWVHCQTLSEALLGHYEDPEDRLGVLVTPMACVAFEDGVRDEPARARATLHPHDPGSRRRRLAAPGTL